MAADLEISVGIDARQTKAGAAEAKSAVKGVGDEVEKTGKKAKSVADRDMKDLERAMKSASIQGSAMGELIGRAFDVIVRGAIQAGQAVYGLAKGFADAGVEIYKAQQITQLSAETLSALAFQARRTGVSMNEVGESFKEFTRLIGDAANGSKEAEAKMSRLGLEPVKAAKNLEQAYRDVLKRIIELPDPISQGNAAMDAFGETGYKLLPFLKSFNGDLDSLIAKARELGVVMSEEDVRAAKEFDATLKDFDESARTVAMTFGKELLPLLKEFFDSSTRWMQQNKGEIKSWAVDTTDFLRGVAVAWREVRDEASLYSDVVLGGIGYATNQSDPKWGAGTGPMAGGWIAVLNGIMAKGRQERAASSGGLKIEMGDPGTYVNMPSPYANNKPYFSSGSAGSTTPKLTEEQKEANRIAKLLGDTLKDLETRIKFYGDETEVGAIKQLAFRNGIDLTTDAIKKLLKEAAKLDNKDIAAEAEKKRLAHVREYDQAMQSIKDSGASGGFALDTDSQTLSKQIQLGRELNDVEKQLIANSVALKQARAELEAATNADGSKKYNATEVTNLVLQVKTQQDLNLKKLEGIQIDRELWAAQQQYKSVIDGLDAEYASLTLQLQEYTTGVQVTTVAILELSEAYKKMSPEQQKAAKAGAERNDQIKATLTAAREATRQYDEFRNTILDGLQAMEGGAGSFFSWMYNRFRRFLQEMVAEWIASKFFKMFFGGGNQQAGAAAGASGGGFLNGIGNVFGQIFGGGRQQGGGGTGVFNPGYFNASGSGGGAGTIAGPDLSNMINTISLRGGGTASAGGGGRFGGLFGSQGFGFNAGTIGGIGALASVFGGMIPGTAGSVISMAGTGASIGAMFGPIGGLIGAGIGGLVGLISGLFGRGKQRKKDEATRTQGMIDALNELKKFDDLIRDVRTLRIDPDSGISQGTQLGDTVRSNYLQMANSLKDKKTRNIALGEVTRIDTVIAQKMSELRGVAEVSRAAGERERRILPEFAGGVYMSPAFQNFRRYNGMLGGAWTGRDTLPAMLAAGEMVLNPMQQNRVRAAAGFDVFKPAGIPGYADGGMAGGVAMAGPMNVTVIVEQDFQGMWRATAESDMGQMVTAKVVEKKYENDEIRLKRRGQ